MICNQQLSLYAGYKTIFFFSLIVKIYMDMQHFGMKILEKWLAATLVFGIVDNSQKGLGVWIARTAGAWSWLRIMSNAGLWYWQYCTFRSRCNIVSVTFTKMEFAKFVVLWFLLTWKITICLDGMHCSSLPKFFGNLLFPYQGFCETVVCMILISQCHVSEHTNLCSNDCESHAFIFCLQVMVSHENQHIGSLKKFGNSDVEVFLYGL
jgi:hypothetical protein